MFKRIVQHPALLLLITGNLYCIWYYNQYPGSFVTVLWIYWFQSVIIGLFNFMQLLSLGDKKENHVPVNSTGNSTLGTGCSATFFLFHYGTFHLVYFIFLLVKFNIFQVEKLVLLTGVAIFMMESLSQFIKQRAAVTGGNVHAGLFFILPYVRIVPMHLVILVPAFFGLQPSIVFLILKLIADLISFLLYRNLFPKA